MSGAIWILIKVADLFLIYSYWQNFFLFEFVRVIFIALDDHEPVIFMEFNFGRNKEDLWKEVLLREQHFIVGLLEFSTFISHRTYNTI